MRAIPRSKEVTASRRSSIPSNIASSHTLRKSRKSLTCKMHWSCRSNRTRDCARLIPAHLLPKSTAAKEALPTTTASSRATTPKSPMETRRRSNHTWSTRCQRAWGSRRSRILGKVLRDQQIYFWCHRRRESWSTQKTRGWQTRQKSEESWLRQWGSVFWKHIRAKN